MDIVDQALHDHFEDDGVSKAIADEPPIDLSRPRHGMVTSYSTLSIGMAVNPASSNVTWAEFARTSSEILQRYLQTNESAIAVEALRELDCSLYHDSFIVMAIQSVLQESDEVQSRIASLLTVLHDTKLISRPQVTRAFEKLIQSAGSLKATIPDVEDRLFSFFAAAEDDGIVENRFMARLPIGLLVNLSQSIIDNEPHLLRNIQLLKEYKEKCQEFMDEFFNSGEASVVEDFLTARMCEIRERTEKEEANLPSDLAIRPLDPQNCRHEFVRRLIQSSLGRTNASREQVSKVLSDMYGTDEPVKFHPDDIQVGILRLLSNVQDLSLDTPTASEMLSKFIVRMVVDDILPPAFVSDFLRLNLGDAMGVQTLRRALAWMTDSAKHHLLAERFQKVWTGTEVYRPEVEKFKKTLRQLIFDYYNTADAATAAARFNELEMSPDQETEAIRKVIVFALEREQHEWALAIAFLLQLTQSREISTDATIKGFDQIREQISDIKIDCPDAVELLDTYFVPKSIELGLLPEGYPLFRTEESET